MSLTDNMPNDEQQSVARPSEADSLEARRAFHPDDISVRMISVGRQMLNVAVKRGLGNRPPLLLFNGIGANWELARPFLAALVDTTAIIFDIPGVGGSPMPALPYRPSSIARLAKELVAELGYERIDVAGVSWGGSLAQQFAHQYPTICRKLVLAATSPGARSEERRVGKECQ